MVEKSPIPTTLYNSSRAKISDGKSVKVTVPEETTINAGKPVLLDGFFGIAMQDAETGTGETDEIILSIEEAEYETDLTNESQTYAEGTPVFWNDSQGVLTETAAGNRFVGRVTDAKDANGVIWFKLSSQANSMTVAANVAQITTDMSADANDDELKTAVNDILTALVDAGIMSS